MPGVPDAYTKLPKPFKAISAVPGRGGKVTTFQIQYANPIPPRDQNRYWQELEKRLGVTIEVSFASGSGGYQEKLPALIAGGDAPDLTFVWLDGAPAANKPVAQGAFLDLGPYLAGDALKDYPNLAAFPPDIWQRAAFNKKIYGVPRPRLRPIGTMTYRQDWAEKVGVPNPVNASDIIKVLTAFSKNDPDGNGKADTWGMGNQNNAAAALFGTRFFFFMFRVPNDWRLNKDGSLTYHIETDEYRQAISFMRQMWDAGVYHPDTLTMTASQVNEYFVGGKIGGYWQGIEGIPGSSGRRGQTKALNPNANVIGLVPPGFDGGKPTVWNFQGFYGFTSIPAKIKDAERVKELLRILDYYAAPFGSEEWIFLNYGIEGIHHDIKPDGTRVKSDLGQKEIGELNNLTYCLPPFYYDTPGDAQYMQQLVTNLSASAIESPVLGYYSPASVGKGGELNQLYIDRQVALITGREPLTAIDQYIKDWRARGGDQIRKEYEDALRPQ